MNKNILITILVVCLAIAGYFAFSSFATGGSSGGIGGKWVSSLFDEYNYVNTLEFSGRNVTLIGHCVEDRSNFVIIGGSDDSATGLVGVEFRIDRNSAKLVDEQHFSVPIYIFQVRGTYSVTGDQIEFVFPNNNVIVHPFSRTENTLTINGVRWDRR